MWGSISSLLCSDDTQHLCWWIMQAVPATAASQQPFGAAAESAGGRADTPPVASADAASAWFTEALGTHCSLVRQQPGARTAFHTRRRHSQDSPNVEARETIGAQRKMFCAAVVARGLLPAMKQQGGILLC
jgi:hypothetical protein